MSEEKQQKDYEQNETQEVNAPREENQDEIKGETIFTGEEKEEKREEEKPLDEKPAFSESIAYQPPTLAQLQDEANKRVFLIVLVVIGIIILFLIGWLIWRAQTKDSGGVEKTPVPVRVGEGQALLSGTITYSSSKPKAGDQGEIGIYLRPANTQTEFADTGLRLSVQEATFNYVYAQTGVNYEVTAFLFYNGQQVAGSTITEAIAPATDIVLDFNVNWNQIMNGWRAGNGTITGLVKIDGYFPVGSKVAIIEDMPTDWGISLEKIFVFEAAGVEMSYTIPNLDETRGHLISAELYDAADNKIGVSVEKMLINADGTGANFLINSVATPTGSGGNTNSPLMKGVVTIDGALRENSQVVVMGRRVDQSEWQTWQTLTNMSTSDIAWQYSGVTEKEDYEVRAVLQVVGETVFTSDIREITAPSRSLNFKVRTNYFLLAPTVLPTINPCVQKGDAWETYVVIPQAQNAKQYWVQVSVGNFNSSGILYSQKHLASNGELSIRIGNLSTGIKNILRYSYAVCQGCGADDNFSPWSKTVSFICN